MNFLHDVYSLTDQFYPPTQNHASEQYAFSIVLQTQTIVNPLEQIIYHYWYRIKKTVVDGELIKLLTPKFLSIPENKKFELTVKLVQKLPTLLDNHILILRDNSIQLFHENKFSKGFAYAVRALIKNPFDMNFFLDVGYHFKRWMKQLLS
jgi:hypothetical protein